MNTKTRKSGRENRKIKKQTLDEEAKLKVQIESYLIKKKAIGIKEQENEEKQVQQPQSSLIDVEPISDVDDNHSSDSDIDRSNDREIPKNFTHDNIDIDAINFSDDGSESFQDHNKSKESDVDKSNHSAIDDDEDSNSEKLSSLKSKTFDVAETFTVSSVVGKSLTPEEKTTLLNQQPCQPLRNELLKRKKRLATLFDTALMMCFVVKTELYGHG